MTDTEPRARRVRTGGRSAAVRAAVRTAVLDLLREGRTDFSVADVARLAEIHRSTAYRWWPTRVALVEEALIEHTGHLAVPDTGSWPGDAAALTRALAEFFADPVERTLNTILAADTDSDVAEVQYTYWQPVERRLAAVIDRAAGRGELRADADPRLILQMLVGPLLLHATYAHTPAPPEIVEGLAAAVVRAFAPD